MSGRTATLAATAVLLAVVASRLLVLLAFHPTDSDVPHYERYAAAVDAIVAARLSHAGGSVADARLGGLTGASSSKIVEYPPLAIAFMAVAGAGAPNVFASAPSPAPGAGATPAPYPDAYADQFRLLLGVIDGLVLVLLVWASVSGLVPSESRARRLALWLVMYGLGGAVLAYTLYDRLDLVVGGLLLAACLLLVRGQWVLSFVALALAINFKAVPIVLAPLWIAGSVPEAPAVAGPWLARGGIVRLVAGRAAVLAGVTALVFAPFLVATGSRAVDFVRFNALRGVQLESIPSSILLALHQLGVPLQVVYRYGAVEVESGLTQPLAAISPVLVVAAVTLAAVAFYRRPGPVSGDQDRPALLRAASTPERFLAATTLVLLLALVLSKLLSPQYLLWLLPIAPLLTGWDRWSGVLQGGFLAVYALSATIYPYLYDGQLARAGAGGSFLDPGLFGVAVLLARNALLVGLAVLVARSMRRPAASISEAVRRVAPGVVPAG